MRTIGLVGGFSWHSTNAYYRLINERIAERLGGHASAQLILRSMNFAELLALVDDGRMPEAQALVVEASASVEAAGADFLLLAANTAHVFADAVAAARSIPLLHVADVTAARVAECGLTRVGLLGTRLTMEGSFLLDRLCDHHGLHVALPCAERRAQVDTLIRDELTVGAISTTATKVLAATIAELVADGAQGIVLACTELTLVDMDAEVPCFDTTALHAQAAAELALDS